MDELSEMDVNVRQIARITERTGKKLGSLRDNTEFIDEKVIPDNPPAAVVSADGGKVQTRAENHTVGVHQPQWKGTNVAHLQIIDPVESSQDPHPDVPKCFLNENHVRALVAQLGSSAKTKKLEGNVKLPPKPKKKESEPKANVLVKSCLASMEPSDQFASVVRNEAERLNMEKAPKKLFVADGHASSWIIHEKFFAHWPALLDIIHLIEHIFHVASVIFRSQKEAWAFYEKLITSAWQGKPKQMLDLLKAQTDRFPPVTKNTPKQDPARILRNAIQYIQNNIMRMDYPEMRRLGLPISSAKVESLIKQINFRVKASDKFWIVSNVEAVLQVRAAALSTTNRWNNFWEWENSGTEQSDFSKIAA